MKKIIYTSLLLFIIHFSFAQVAINANGATANASAMLDISSSSKGLLIPRVYLTSAVDNTTISNPQYSLLVYNTNSNMSKNAGFYYNSGNAANPMWQAMQDLVLPFYKAVNTSGTGFAVDNYSGVTTSAAIQGASGGSGRGIEGVASGGGTGVYARSFSGNALEVSGKMKIAGKGQLPAPGKVLTSDTNGNATWEGAVAFSAQWIAAFAEPNIPQNTDYIMPLKNKNYDLGNNYSLQTHMFTAPVKGIYHFDVLANWGFITDDMAAFLFLNIKRNGTESRLASNEIEVNSNGYYGMNLSYECLLEAGDLVYPAVYHTADVNMELDDSYSSYFNGRLVIKL
ncbi:MAG: hypothetical protein V4717_23625 [Bacteroidota bacterium]